MRLHRHTYNAGWPCSYRLVANLPKAYGLGIDKTSYSVSPMQAQNADRIPLSELPKPHPKAFKTLEKIKLQVITQVILGGNEKLACILHSMRSTGRDSHPGDESSPRQLIAHACLHSGRDN